jgi:hypothetical protein
MPKLPDSTKDRLRAHYDHIQEKINKNYNLIASIEHILTHNKNLENIPYQVYSASETLREGLTELRHKQSKLEHEAQILYFALLLNPRPGETSFEERTDTWYFLLKQYRDLKANQISSDSQFITDLDTAIHNIRQHIQSGDPFPEPHTPPSPGAYYPNLDLEHC